MLEPSRVRCEMRALQTHFRTKRDYVIGRLEEMGFKLAFKPNSTFYIWLDLSELPESINDGLNFFQACLEENVIVVPGIFFDLNPSKRRDLFDSPCHREFCLRYNNYLCWFSLFCCNLQRANAGRCLDFVRLSYGPRMDILVKGMDAIERIVKK